MDRDERRYLLALQRAPGVSRAALRAFLEDGRPLAGLFKAAPPGKGAAARAAPDWSAVDRALAWLDAAGAVVLPLHHPHYPPVLRQIPDAPPLLFALGDVQALQRPQLAVVGSRHPTPTGRDLAGDFARRLAGAGLGIASGLAEGIDAAAHRGAIAAGGFTTAVLGTGLDRVYPLRHRALAEDIARRGVLVTEFPPGTGPRPGHFPQRNRIISGLSLGTLVVEAAARSGSLITARCAAEQGREVFAVPGSVLNPMTRGCHALIREGAKLVETVDDILVELHGLCTYVLSEGASASDNKGNGRTPAALDGPARRVLEALGFDPTPVDVVIERSGLTPGEVSSMLLVLELQGFVAATAVGRYCRNKV